MRKIAFDPKGVCGTLIEAFTGSVLAAQGMSPEMAALAGSVVGNAATGFSLEDPKPGETIIGSMETAVRGALESADLPPESRRQLEQLLTADGTALDAVSLVRFMVRPDADRLLRGKIRDIIRQDGDADPATFPVDDLVGEFRRRFEREALHNPALAGYATFLMTYERLQEHPFRNANRDYADSFTAPLFLHRDKDERVRLENLFVLQDYDLVKDKDEIRYPSDRKRGLRTEIAAFLRSGKPFLFIEGDAGSGKSTLTAWMNYHFLKKDDIAEELFGNRTVLTVRLRDLNREDLEGNRGGMKKAVRKYLNLKSLREIAEQYPGAVLLLDGFDELCMIEGKRDSQSSLLYELDRARKDERLDGVQFIITSRPQFLPDLGNLHHGRIILRHFDAAHRETWLDCYTGACGQTVDDALRSRILGGDIGAEAVLCDTPLTLYMLCAMPDAPRYLENNWALYHHIFHDALSETDYNRMFPNRDPDRDYRHDIAELREVLYRVSEELAYRMYQRGNADFYLSENDVSDIIQQLSQKMRELKEPGTRTVAENCYALCCYWKLGAQKGAVEFLHNNIRDFFLAEKLYREMNARIPEHPGRGTGDTAAEERTVAAETARRLSELCQYGPLEGQVCEFVYLRALYQAKENARGLDFAAYEYEHRMVWRVIEELSGTAFTDSHALEVKLPSLNFVQRIQNVLTCLMQIYRYAYKAHFVARQDTETLIPWVWEGLTPWHEEDLSQPLIPWVWEGHDGPSPDDTHNLLNSLLAVILCWEDATQTVDRKPYLGIRGNFRGLHLSYCNLSKLVLNHSNFTRANLLGADLRSVDMISADMRNANLQGAALESAYLRYVDLEGADLRNADLRNARLMGATLRYANLKGAILPDSYVSRNQDEQVEHLKSLNIPDLKI